MAVPRVPQRKLVMNLVPVAATATRPREVPGKLEILDDLGDGSLGDADALGDVSESRGGVHRDALEDMGVVRDESPRMVVA